MPTTSLSGGRTLRSLQDVIITMQENVYQFLFKMFTCTLRNNLDLIQIRYEDDFYADFGAGKYPNCACAHLKQLNLIGQIRYRETIVKNNRCRCSCSEKIAIIVRTHQQET